MENKYRQFTSIDRWDDNAQYFDPLLEKIKNNKAYEVVEDMKTWPESDIENLYTFSEIVCGKANNSGELPEYKDDTENDSYILTASETTITLFKKV